MKKRQQYEIFTPPDGWHWFKNWIPLRTGGYNIEWRIAHVVDGTVEILGPALTLIPESRYLHLAMWGPAIPHPDGGVDQATALTSSEGMRRQKQKRLGIASFTQEPTGPDVKASTVAEGIADAFVNAAEALAAHYRDHPQDRAELVGRIAASLGRAFGGGSIAEEP